MVIVLSSMASGKPFDLNTLSNSEAALTAASFPWNLATISFARFDLASFGWAVPFFKPSFNASISVFEIELRSS